MCYIEEITVKDTNRQYYVLKSLGKFEMELPVGFFRCHRSIIVNMAYIHKIDKHGIQLINGICLPVSRCRVHLLENKLMELPSLSVCLCKRCLTCPDIHKCVIISSFVT
jgi:hypothetical protein